MAVEPSGARFRVSHVLLDVDGTLLNYGDSMRAAIQAAAATCSAITSERITTDHLMAARELVAAEPEWRAAPVANVRREATRHVLAAYDVDTHAHVQQVMDAYEDARDRAMTVYPDVHETLASLHALGLTLIAASNGNVDLARVGISEHISATYYAVDAGVAKPDPRFFTGALERFGLTPDAALFVGDRLDNDYLPARAAGIHAILLDRPSASRTSVDDSSVLRIKSLLELPDMVERL